MDSKTLSVLEYPKVLGRLAAHCDFSASKTLALALEPTTSYDLALAHLQETSEARHLLSVHDVSIGGAHDIRPQAELAARGGVLEPLQLLDVKSTLIACRELKNFFERSGGAKSEAEPQPKPRKTGRDGGGSPFRPYIGNYPRLSDIALALPDIKGLVDSISRAISDRGDVLDSASPKLASIRAELKVAHERLMTRLQRYLTDPKTVPMLQDTLITQRDGRYVIPLRAEFKGQIKSIVHDQSSSGATLFIEPIAIVELNNTYREVQLAERDEVRRVLAELSGQVGLSAAELRTGLEALADLDLAFAKAKYAEEIHASEPLLHPLSAEKKGTRNEKKGVGRMGPVEKDGAVGQSQIQNLQSQICLLQARHPLLDPHTVVPIDVDPAPGTRAIVITGPNTGGKTVTLKTVGLLVIMAQSGLHIPAQSGSELPLFQAVLADIGDEQSIEQSLSTFSGHITNIIRILKRADERSLVILDELGAGTDPQEGAALARAILSHLLARGITTLVATHYPELKTFAHGTEGVVNASLEFDIGTLRPTYRLTIGLPGRSNALAIATRLGLPSEIVADAKSEVNPENLRADKLLDDIRKERNRASREREKAEKARQKAEETARALEKRLEKIEDERREILAQGRAEAELEAAVLRRNIDSLKAQLKKARQPLEAVQKVEEKLQWIEEEVAQPVERQESALRAAEGSKVMRLPTGRLKLGEKVALRTLGAEGIITALGENDAEVQVGSLRIRAKMGDISRKAEEVENEQVESRQVDKKKAEVPAYVSTLSTSSPTPSMELDLRGQSAEDALATLDDYLDRAYLAGMPFVRIIHGKGTGKLRQEVRARLRGHPHVSAWVTGQEAEGGDGVTVAKIVRE
jgi:DNA mismatch repair protein MutS2